MKLKLTPVELIELMCNIMPFKLNDRLSIEPYLIEAIEFYGKQCKVEAISETVNACAEAAKTVKIGNSGSWYDAEVDKQSILDVENQLKAKL